jgi:hypothetical protein
LSRPRPAPRDPLAAFTQADKRADGANTVDILNAKHIAEGHAADHAHSHNMWLASEQLISLGIRPAVLIINGDLTVSVGVAIPSRRRQSN